MFRVWTNYGTCQRVSADQPLTRNRAHFYLWPFHPSHPDHVIFKKIIPVLCYTPASYSRTPRRVNKRCLNSLHGIADLFFRVLRGRVLPKFCVWHKWHPVSCVLYSFRSVRNYHVGMCGIMCEWAELNAGWWVESCLRLQHNWMGGNA